MSPLATEPCLRFVRDATTTSGERAPRKIWNDVQLWFEQAGVRRTTNVRGNMTASMPNDAMYFHTWLPLGAHPSQCIYPKFDYCSLDLHYQLSSDAMIIITIPYRWSLLFLSSLLLISFTDIITFFLVCYPKTALTRDVPDHPPPTTNQPYCTWFMS